MDKRHVLSLCSKRRKPMATVPNSKTFYYLEKIFSEDLLILLAIGFFAFFMQEILA